MAEILVVEDDELHADLMKLHLKALGHQLIGICDNAEDALLLISNKKPQIMLLDISIKGASDGIGLAEKINKYHQIPTVFTTSHTDPEIIERASKTKPDAYLIKPIDQNSLRAAIEIALAKNGNATQAYEIEFTAEPHKTSGRHLFIKVGRMLKRIHLHDIDFIASSEDKYCDIHLNSGAVYAARTTLSKLAEELSDQFVRTHRGYVVNIQNIEGIDEHRSEVKFRTSSIPIGRTYRTELYNKINRLG